MVRYKNFGVSSGEASHQSMGSFSFSSHPSTKTKGIQSSKKSNSKNHGAKWMGQEEHHNKRMQDVRDDDDTEDMRVLSKDSDTKEGEAESLYDMTSYNGVNDEHSTSVCASYSYYDSVGDTESSLGTTDGNSTLSPLQQNTLSPSSRRSKLSYMGYVPVSPNTAAAMAMQDGNELRDGVEDENNINGNHSSSGRTETTGTTFPSIKVDDTSTTRRRQRQFDGDEFVDDTNHQSPPGASVASIATGEDCSSMANIAEYISPGQQRLLKEQQEAKDNNRHEHPRSASEDAATVVSSVNETSRVEDSTTASAISSVMPNSYAGNPVMNQSRNHKDPRLKQDYQTLSPIKGEEMYPCDEDPIIHHHKRSAFHSVVPTSNQKAPGDWVENSSAGLSTTENKILHKDMTPPSLNHPNQVEQWNQNENRYYANPGQHHGQSFMPVGSPHQSYQLPNAYENTNREYTVHQHQHQRSQPFSGFTPRNPVLVQQLQVFQQYHNQQQRKSSQSRSQHSVDDKANEITNGSQVCAGACVPETNSSENESKVSGTDHTKSVRQPFLVCGPGGPVLQNVEFVTPATAKKKKKDEEDDDDLRFGHNIQYGGALDNMGVKCQNLVTNLLGTCGAIVTHGYHIDGKSKSKQKKSKFEKVADQSIEGLAAKGKHHPEDDSFATNAKKIFDAGNQMMSIALPKDFQNLTQSAAYHNVFDTFQKYYESGREREDPPVEEEAAEESASTSKLGAVSMEKTPNTTQEKPVSPKSSISTQRELFRKLRRRRNRTEQSPIRRTNSAPDPALPGINSPKSKAEKEKALEASYDTERFKERYSRNLADKLASKDEKKPDEKQLISLENQDDDSMHSWATPQSREESSEHCNNDPEGTHNQELNDEEKNDDLATSSSGMSDSLVGSDVDENELLESAISEEDPNEEDQESIVEFPHTPLDVIEEGSMEEDTSHPHSSVRQDTTDIESTADSGTFSILSLSAHSRNQALTADPDGALSFDEIDGDRYSILSVNGVLRFLFISVLLFQCGAMISMWDEVADHIRTLEGGPQAIATAESIALGLKARGISLMKCAEDMFGVQRSAVDDIFADIDLSTSSWMETANRLFKSNSMDRDDTDNYPFDEEI